MLTATKINELVRMCLFVCSYILGSYIFIAVSPHTGVCVINCTQKGVKCGGNYAVQMSNFRKPLNARK